MVNSRGRTLNITHHGLIDLVLKKGIALPYNGTGELRCFKVAGFIGRRIGGDIIGKNMLGSNSANSANIYPIKYEMKGSSFFYWNLLQSPISDIETSKYILPKLEGPSVVGKNGAVFTARGGVEVERGQQPGSFQFLKVWFGDKDVIVDDRLVKLSIKVNVPPEAFCWVLLPYVGKATLFKNKKGHVAGNYGSSGESTAEVYQEPVTSGWMFQSDTIDVRVTP